MNKLSATAESGYKTLKFRCHHRNTMFTQSTFEVQPINNL